VAARLRESSTRTRATRGDDWARWRLAVDLKKIKLRDHH
jgi:hypothetical protein